MDYCEREKLDWSEDIVKRAIERFAGARERRQPLRSNSSSRR